jgi:hypothetical protein
VDDSNFRDFTALLKHESDTTVHVTVVGTFFSGEKRTLNGRTSWGGPVTSVVAGSSLFSEWNHFTRTRADLDYTAEAGWYEQEGCNVRSVSVQRTLSMDKSESDSGTETVRSRAKRMDAH